MAWLNQEPEKRNHVIHGKLTLHKSKKNIFSCVVHDSTSLYTQAWDQGKLLEN